jgi:small GTP-binding protein
MMKDNLPTGFRLIYRLDNHSETINCIKFSPDAKLIASAAFDGWVLLWEVTTGNLWQRLAITATYPRVLEFSPDGARLAVGCTDKTIQIWNLTGQLEQVLNNHTRNVNTLAWSPDGTTLASGADDGMIILWDTQSWQICHALSGHAHRVNSVAFSPTGNLLASGGDDKFIYLWQPQQGVKQARFKGHLGMVLSIAFSPQQPLLVSAASDKTIQLWDIQTGRSLRILEGHTDVVYKLALSHDGQVLASKSDDNTIRLWRGDVTAPLAVLEETTEAQLWLGGLAFHPSQPLLATLGNQDRAIRLWQIDLDQLLANQPQVRKINRWSHWLKKLWQPPISSSSSLSNSVVAAEVPQLTPTVHYTTAKIALVGDSGVGKTGLGWRLAHGHFQEQASTHGQQFWIIQELGGTRTDGTECEAVLWDLAGQPDYRLVHALFLDDVDLALILFDPTHPQHPFKGVEYWLKQLRHQNKSCQIILVAARCDRGTPALTTEELEQFCQHQGITHGYVITSALTGESLNDLMVRVQQALRWEEMTATITTLTFRRIKELVLQLKETRTNYEIILTPATLRTQLTYLDPAWQFSDAELMTALQHLSHHGYVSILRNSAGEAVILLVPDLLANLAASLVLEARRNDKGLGALEEARVLRGDYQLPELISLQPHDRQILLDAAVVLFLEHTICFRETIDDQVFLVFPGLINQKRPLMVQEPILEDSSYTVTGAIENIYSALVVLLGYTNTFTRIQQWQNQVQYEVETGQLCGIRKVEEHEGQLELVLYYSQNTAVTTQTLFKNLLERFLRGREVTVAYYAPVICTICGYRQERSEVTKRLNRQKTFMFCGECGGKISLSPLEPEWLPNDDTNKEMLEREQSSAHGRTQFAKALVWVKSYWRDRLPSQPSPRCFISYAWGIPEHERWVKQLAVDILDAGIEVILDDWDNSSLGSSVSRFISQIETANFIIVVGTPLFKEKYLNKLSATGSVVAAEVDLITQRLIRTEAEKSTILPLLLAGDDSISLPPLLRGRAYGDFREENFYFIRLFELILTLYQIDFRDPAVRDLRDELRTEAQRHCY